MVSRQALFPNLWATTMSHFLAQIATPKYSALRGK